MDSSSLHEQVDHFRDQDRGQDARSDPHPRFEPDALCSCCLWTEVEHHDDEYEKDHDGSRVDDHLQGSNEGRAERVENHRHRK